MASNNNNNVTSDSKALVLASETPAPPRPLLFKPFNFLKCLSLSSIGMGLKDVPSNCGKELSFLVGSMECPIKLKQEGESSRSQKPILETPEAVSGETEPSPCGSFPETAPQPEEAPELIVEDSPESPPNEKASTPLGSRSGEKRKMVKMVAKRLRTPRSRPQPSAPSSPTPSKPSRTSARLASKPSSKTTFKTLDSIMEEISSSSSGGTQNSDSDNTPFKKGTPVFSESSDEQNPSKPSTKPVLKTTKSKTPLKRKTETSSAATSSSKRPKESTSPPLTDKHVQLLRRHVLRGIVNPTFFKEQGLEVLLQKMKAQGWLDLFANTEVGCSAPELAEFYANYTVTEGV